MWERSLYILISIRDIFGSCNNLFLLLAGITPKLILQNCVHWVRQDGNSRVHHYKTSALKLPERLNIWQYHNWVGTPIIKQRHVLLRRSRCQWRRGSSHLARQVEKPWSEREKRGWDTAPFCKRVPRGAHSRVMLWTHSKKHPVYFYCLRTWEWLRAQIRGAYGN